MNKELTKIELFCEDNSVGRIQRMLAQIRGVYDVKTVPVVNAGVKANGKVKAVTGGNVMEQLAAYLDGKRGQPLTPNDVKGWLESIGKSRTSYGHFLKRAVEERLVVKRGHGTKMTYTVKP